MAKRVICCAIAFAMLVPAVTFAGDKVFGVQPSTTLQSANLGFDRGKLTPYIGFDMVVIGVDVKSEDYDNWGDGYWNEETIDASGSAIVLIPTFGVRYALSEGNELEPYLFGSFFKSFAFVSAEGKEVHKWADPYGSGQDVDDYELDKEEEEIIEEILGVWGIDFGFGVEYPILRPFQCSRTVRLEGLLHGGRLRRVPLWRFWATRVAG